jgi:hypothetical protein
MPNTKPVVVDDRRKPRFDMTINLGHVITLIAFVISGFAFWNSVDKRILVLEVANNSQRERDINQDLSSKEKFTEVRESLRDLRRSVDKLADAITDQRVITGSVKK